MQTRAIAIPLPAQVILSLAAILLAGFGATRLTKKLRLPNVTGYIIAGVLIGPYVLNLIPQAIIDNMGFVTDMALAFIAFGVGRYFKVATLKRNGPRVIVITLFEALTAAFLITLAMIFIFHLPVAFALLLGAIGSATAPASTIMTIRQYRARGELVDTILQVVALDDAVSLLAFSVCAVIVRASTDGGANATGILLPVLGNVASLAAGAALGWLLVRLTGENRSTDHRLVLVSAFVFLLTGLCSAIDISPLLACMVMGMVFVNCGGNKKVFKQVNRFTPDINLIFFVLSGMRLSIPSLASAGLIGLGYFLVRIAGKYMGAWAGARVTGAGDAVRQNLGLALVPQAGVSIGLALLGQRILPPESGALLTTIILSSGFLYELVGPACAKYAMGRAGCFRKERGKATQALTADTADLRG